MPNINLDGRTSGIVKIANTVQTVKPKYPNKRERKQLRALVNDIEEPKPDKVYGPRGESVTTKQRLFWHGETGCGV